MVTKSARDGARSQEAGMLKDGALVVRRSLQIKATPERVWREFETFDRFRAWWATDMEDRTEGVRAYEPRVGGRVELPCSWGPHGDAPGGSCVFAGTVTVFEPARELTFDFVVEDAGWPAPTYVTVRLTPNGYGTLVEILHYGFEAVGATAVETFSDFEGGWDLRELRQLRAAVETL